MKILVFAYDLVVAGVTVNAIELSAALRDLHGHDVVLFAGPGPLRRMAEERAIRLVEAPPAWRAVHPAPVRLRALREIVRREQPDLIYAWDWAQCVDAFFVEHLWMGVPIVVTDMCMIVQRLLPKSIPTTFGTPELAERARAKGFRFAEYLLPPVDVKHNAPEAADGYALRTDLSIEGGETVLVTVSRLDTEMKSESLKHTIEAVRAIGREHRLRLVIVGDGDARHALEALAQRANAELGREAITLTGTMVDPRPAYAMADIVIGMGSSALRGMAFAKPVLVVGERGFSARFEPATAATFLRQGIYGLGDGRDGAAKLAANLRALLDRADDLPALGAFARAFVVEHYSLESVSARLSSFCGVAVRNQPRRHIALLDGMRTAAVWIRERRFMPIGFSLRRRLRAQGSSSAARAA